MSELRTAARKIRSLPNQMVRAGADHMKKPLGTRLKLDTGGDQRLSGLGGTRLKVATSARGTDAARGFVRLVPPGPGSWLNAGTRRRQQGSGWHPGTAAKKTFDEPIERHKHEALREMQRLFSRALR